MNYLGIDYGKSKIGLAIAKTSVATPFSIVKTIDEIKEIINQEEVDEIVVGYPLSLSGEEGIQTKETDEFIAQLGILGKLIHKQDERFSSRSAINSKNNHASAATLILQTFLERQNK